jgi:hypothetical protein
MDDGVEEENTMTPRALLTAIGATAIGFALIIGSVAAIERAEEMPLQGSARAAMTLTMEAAGAESGDAVVSDAAGTARLAAWNDTCVIAL